MLSLGHHANPELISKIYVKNNVIEKFEIYCFRMPVHDDSQIIKIHLEEQVIKVVVVIKYS